jgi:ATP-dependent helicase/nuclease subunit B
VPSRFWLRLEAMGGERVTRDHELRDIARALDAPPGPPQPAKRPMPAPPSNARPRELSVTQVEKLRADPYSFYADKVLGLRKLGILDEDPTAAERGTFIHAILERWTDEKPDDPAHLRAVADLMLGEWDHHPLMRALWAPRVRRAVDWVAETVVDWSNAPERWRPAAAEAKGRVTLGNGITLTGRADRIDRGEGGALAIVDYKSGEPPSHAQHAGGYALQLGLLAWMASDGHFARVAPGPVRALRYWKLSGGRTPGKVVDPMLYRGKAWEDGTDLGGFIDASMARFFELCDEMLLGSAPFVAKLHPEYSTRYTDHDHLARVAEWMGRGE